MRGEKGVVGWEVVYTDTGPVNGVSPESSDLFLQHPRMSFYFCAQTQTDADARASFLLSY